MCDAQLLAANMASGSTAPTPDFLAFARTNNATQVVRGVVCTVWTGQGESLRSACVLQS